MDINNKTTRDVYKNELAIFQHYFRRPNNTELGNCTRDKKCYFEMYYNQHIG